MGWDGGAEEIFFRCQKSQTPQKATQSGFVHLVFFLQRILIHGLRNYPHKLLHLIDHLTQTQLLLAIAELQFRKSCS
jgi:hypothetical protein